MNEGIRIDNIKLHPIFEDIESIFWFFILANNTLANPETRNIIKKGNDPVIISMLEKYENNVGLKTKINNRNNRYNSKANIKKETIVIGKTMAILTYDYILLSEYFSILSPLEEFKFLKFIRNGAAHCNKFNLKDEKGNWKLSERELISWNEKNIDRGLHKTTVFNNFVFFGDMFLLANFFSEKIKEFNGSK
ncbi:MAG: Uncharacterized protein Athens071425_26 [Parcubacteria group bacterium Athens0714_25]|nr:MAG: Uncharacterized protein Athens071425_26 [Parcubacteria group bacterium Athens0714_25]